jgi:LysR family transcriptional regulator for metE and metH
VDVQIRVSATERPIEALLEGQIDLAIVTSEVDDQRIVVSPLFQDELVVVVAPTHPFARRTFVDPDDLADEHLIVYTIDRATSFIFSRVLGPAGVEPARVSQVPLTEAILELVKAGLGISVMARWAIEPAIRSAAVRGLRITRRGVHRAWSAVALRDRVEPKWQREFIALLSKQALPAKLERMAR